MYRYLAVLLVAGLIVPACAPAGASTYDSGPSCSKGCPCGNSCIDCSKTCRGGSTYKPKSSYKRRR